MTTDPVYPNVRCHWHPFAPPAPGYCVCVHVIDEGAAIARFDEATPDVLGAILCERCEALPELDAAHVTREDVAHLRIVCARCVLAVLMARAPHPEVDV